MANLAIFSADNLEGQQLLEALSDLEPAPESLRLYSAAAYDAEPAMYRGRPLDFRPLEDADYTAIDIAVFMPGQSLGDCVEAAELAGCRVLDAADVLAQRGDVPVYGAGGELPLDARSIAIADAVSSHIALVLRLLPAVRRVDVAVAQPVSVAGKEGVDALAAESARLLNGQALESSALAAQIAFNVLPIPAAKSAEIEHNLGALLAADGVRPQVNCQAVMAAVFYGHCAMLRAEFDEPLKLGDCRTALLGDARFRVLLGEGEELASPAGLKGSETIDIAELALDRRSDNVLRCTLVADNLRKGVVLNIIELLKILIKNDI